jgi:ribosome-binding ATPase
MKVGIVGLPNAGKSSLFNALTQAGAEAANYPFTTVEPNVAVVPVPDERLDAVVATVKATPTVYETIEFHDIAGLVRGAHKGEGLGNQFLANIRETDALVHVVRAHGDEQVVHPEGRVDPLGDIETIETELLYADLEQAERRLEKVRKEAKGGEREKVAERDWLEQLIAALQEGRTARTVPTPDDAPDALRNLHPLTAKPVLYLANIDEGSAHEPPAVVVEHAVKTDARAVAVSARLESELGELDEEDAAAMRADLGVEESGLATVVRGAWELLGLISFFTAGEGKEGRAWAIRRGTSARRAAGRIHTDIEKGFVAAEVVKWRDLVDTGGYSAAREQAKLRVEGRDYEVQDGDVMTVRFTP